MKMARMSACEEIDSLPTPEEFSDSLGNWAYFLYVTTGLVAVTMLAQFCYLISKISAPVEHFGPTVWVHSIYAIAIVLSAMSLGLPKAGPYISSVYKIFIGIAMVKFVELLLFSIGGDHRILDHFNDLTFINLKSPPFCCCFCCPTRVHMTQRKLTFMKYSVYQMPFIQFLCIFTVDLLGKAEYSSYYNFSGTDENVYLQGAMTMSFFSAMWGLFQLMSITVKFQLVEDKKFKYNAVLLKILVVIVNVQGLIIDVLIYSKVFGCSGQLGPRAIGGIVRDVTLLVEAFILGNLAFYINVKL